MIRSVEIVRGSLDARLAALGEPWSALGPLAGAAGAWLEFRGVVRRDEPGETGAAGLRLAALEYEAHEEMAVHQMERILDRLADAYPLAAMLVLHRVGVVAVGEASLLVRVLSPHRREALAACAEFIDELKRRVPIWKHAVPEASG